MDDAANYSSRRVIATYITTNVLFTLAASIIWGVNTLFLMDAGLDIFQVLLVNSAFTVGQLVFEVPTGVVADTVGRKTSFLLGIGALFASTLWYVGSAEFGWGLWSFIGASVLLGFGFTCQTGAVDAWLVDALDHTGYARPKERVFAWGGMSFSSAMLVGTLAGGVLGQADLALPYVVRSALLFVTLAVTAVMMREVGFKPRPLHVRTFGTEAKKIARAGVEFGWQHPVVRPLLLVSFAGGLYFLFAFYAWQRYALDLLGRELVWVSATLVAGFSAAGILGNLLVGRVMGEGESRRRPARVLGWLTATATLCSVGMGAVGLAGMAPGIVPLAMASALWLVFGVAYGMLMPVRQAFINEQIPSAHRATVLSLDSFFADGGGAIGQPGLGWVARSASIPLAYLVGTVGLAAGVPLYAAAGRAATCVDEVERAPSPDEEALLTVQPGSSTAAAAGLPPQREAARSVRECMHTRRG